MTADHRPALRSALYAKSRSFTPPRRLEPAEILEVCQEVALVLIAEAVKASKKERKKSGIDERARDILNVYPRREGGDAALLSITKAIQKDGFEAVLEKTTEYASAVARWSHSRKKAANGSSLIPMATTWFNGRRYLDDSAQWWEGTGGKAKAATVTSLPVPENWLQWLTTELSLISEEHPAHSQLLYSLNSRTFNGMPESWQARCKSQLKQA